MIKTSTTCLDWIDSLGDSYKKLETYSHACTFARFGCGVRMWQSSKIVSELS